MYVSREVLWVIVGFMGGYLFRGLQYAMARIKYEKKRQEAIESAKSTALSEGSYEARDLHPEKRF